MSSPVSEASASARHRGFWWRWSFRLARAVVLAYLVVCIIVFAIQTNYIFPGAAATQGQKDASVERYYEKSLVALRTSDGTQIAALFGKALEHNGLPMKDTRHCPTIIYFYGNGACMAYSTDVFQHFRRLGANVIIPDYEGYGMSAGKPSEAGCYAAADAAYDYLLKRDDIDRKLIVPIGWSLGAATAIDLASRRPVAGLVTISAFTSIRAMAHLFVRWLPMSLILRCRFDNIRKIAEIHCPILIMHGTDDELIPFAMSNQLAAAAGGPVTRFNIIGGQHNDVFDVGGLELLNQIEMFLEKVEKSVGSSAAVAASQPALG
jgi:uncharacterized protein